MRRLSSACANMPAGPTSARLHTTRPCPCCSGGLALQAMRTRGTELFIPLTRSCCTQSVLCGQSAALTLHTADAFGNVCTSGGHDVAFVHQAAGGNKAYKVSPKPLRCSLRIFWPASKSLAHGR